MKNALIIFSVLLVGILAINLAFDEKHYMVIRQFGGIVVAFYMAAGSGRIIKRLIQ